MTLPMQQFWRLPQRLFCCSTPCVNIPEQQTSPTLPLSRLNPSEASRLRLRVLAARQGHGFCSPRGLCAAQSQAAIAMAITEHANSRCRISYHACLQSDVASMHCDGASCIAQLTQLD